MANVLHGSIWSVRLPGFGFWGVVMAAGTHDMVLSQEAQTDNRVYLVDVIAVSGVNSFVSDILKMATTTTVLQSIQTRASVTEHQNTKMQALRPRVEDTFMDGLSTIDGTGATIGRSAPIKGIPKFPDPYQERKWMLERMAGAFRVIARKGYVEGTAGHISIRDPVDPETFWINPLARHFGLMKASDMVHVNMKGEIIGGNYACINNAGFNIHSALHEARPDVNAACHFHSIHGKAWSAFGRPLEMLNQDACTFFKDHAVHDMFGGIAFETSEGERIATALGNKRCAILKNHGLLTTGKTVDEAAFLYTLMENSCRIQLLAEAAVASGIEKHLCPDAEAEYTYRLTTPEAMWLEFQPDYEYELAMSGGDFLS
ncbi:L-fuculose-phosphate aldolase [Colletotrichum scovillei]|uniref:L-fuculose-phosphate aldolase n=3 Tax=Colletotrichum acutatum species complex TaxID=2707335 RepID=A0A9P7QXN0_9PEZI|nr:L-fuculose-phosphate aldolase [Colletotrichum scovillei]KAG7052247.1 L-fuculose-phosphate aldolase [Colletotrichum scovillei]KAG7064537.1 L-fuculose-phosphate aldolase [Colletotrichum scovillei]